MKAIEQYFPVVPFTMLYKVVLPFESVDEILKCDHVQGGSNVWISIKSKNVTINMNSIEPYDVLSCGAVYSAVRRWF